MPELPEVEAVRRALARFLEGETITTVEAQPDPIEFRGVAPRELEKGLVGRTVETLDRKGKYLWLQLDRSSLIVHFGMSGWAHIQPHGEPEPRFTKLTIECPNGRVAFTDQRRLGRIWLTGNPAKDPRIAALGFDVLDDLPSGEALYRMIHQRKTPIKAVLLDQAVFAGIGNYLADEVLYQARIAPRRQASELSEKEVTLLRSRIQQVVRRAVEVDADSDRFPENWLFHHRWGGKRGPEKIGRHEIVRETIAGRTTAWVPGVQK